MDSHGITYIHDGDTLVEGCMLRDVLFFSWFIFMTKSLNKMTKCWDNVFLYVYGSMFCFVFYHIELFVCVDLELGLVMDYEYTIKFSIDLIS